MTTDSKTKNLDALIAAWGFDIEKDANPNEKSLFMDAVSKDIEAAEKAARANERAVIVTWLLGDAFHGLPSAEMIATLLAALDGPPGGTPLQAEIQASCEKAQVTQDAMLEDFAKAWIAKTKLDPRDAMLAYEQTGTGKRPWWRG